MLKQLTIKNFALIDHITIDFANSFNVLTGETGAGKSLIVEAIGLLIGHRASSDFIREGSDKAFIEGYFELSDDKVITELEDLGLEVNDGLILARELLRNGRNSCRINGRLVPLSYYNEVGTKLVDIHGQSQESDLLSLNKQMNLLDDFAGTQALKSKNRIHLLYNDIKELKTKINDYQSFMENREAKLDFLKHQISEIENACLRSGEEEELQQEKNILLNYERFVVCTNNAYIHLFKGEIGSNSAYDLVSYALQELEKIKDIDSTFNTIAEKLHTLIFELEEFAREIKKHADDIEYDPYRLEVIEQRLNVIRDLKRKYNGNVEEIIQKLSVLKEEHTDLQQSITNLESYEKKLSELEVEIKKECELLHEMRLKAARDLENLVNQALEELDLPQAQFSIHVDLRDTYESFGMDKVEFFFSPNKGESSKPLAKIASGGEISRVMLALKSILNQYDNVSTIIFDEIDTGVGGETIINLSKKISKLATKSQVICVTHSPALASFADLHYLIFKVFKNKRTVTRILKLDYNERIKELSRMLGGAEQIDTALKHAKEMLKFARKEKCV